MVFGSRRVAAAMMGLMMAASRPASAQLFWKTPDFRGAPVQGSEPGVMIPLPGATPAELNAEIVWTMRAGLNFAALQCQFAPSLMTVDTYNALITHHSKELATDYKMLQTYFKRTAAKGTSPSAVAAAFDSYQHAHLQQLLVGVRAGRLLPDRVADRPGRADDPQGLARRSSRATACASCATASCRPPIWSIRRSRSRNSPASTCPRCRRPASIATARSRRSACRQGASSASSRRNRAPWTAQPGLAR